MSSWQESIRTSIKSSKELATFLNLEVPETSFKVMIPKEYALKIRESSALKKQFLPNTDEDTIDTGLIDPTGDHIHSTTSRLVHRYENRALFFPTETCPIICRYCFRKNELGVNDNLFSHKEDNQKIKDYLNIHKEIEEIIFTGGDPLILSNDKLRFWLNFFSEIPSIKMIRFHTRTPVIIPERIDHDFCQLVEEFSKKFDVITLVIHTNHKDEWIEGFKTICQRLRKLPIQLFSQSVLLKGVNDNPHILKDLFYGLSSLGVTPYYLHHPDQAKGAMHFYISLEEGLSIYQELKKLVSGWALPKYVTETPLGGGKITVEKAIYDIDKKVPIS